VSTKKTKTKAKPLYDDGDDAHFSDNPAVPKRTRRKWEAEERKRVGGASSKRGGVHKQGMSTIGGKKKTTRKRVAGK